MLCVLSENTFLTFQSLKVLGVKVALRVYNVYCSPNSQYWGVVSRLLPPYLNSHVLPGWGHRKKTIKAQYFISSNLGERVAWYETGNIPAVAWSEKPWHNSLISWHIMAILWWLAQCICYIVHLKYNFCYSRQLIARQFQYTFCTLEYILAWGITLSSPNVKQRVHLSRKNLVDHSIFKIGGQHCVNHHLQSGLNFCITLTMQEPKQTAKLWAQLPR